MRSRKRRAAHEPALAVEQNDLDFDVLARNDGSRGLTCGTRHFVAERNAFGLGMRLVPPARQDGLSAKAGKPPQRAALIATLIGFIVLVLCLGFGGGLLAAMLRFAGRIRAFGCLGNRVFQ